MLILFKLIHIFVGLNALGAGAAVCAKMVTGRPFEMWVKYFLRFSLAAGSTGLILSIGHPSVTQFLTMLTVYASAFAVFSWRKYSTSDNWGPAVVLSTMGVLGLDTFIMIAHVFTLLAPGYVMSSAQPGTPLAVSIAIVVLLFGLLSTIALKRIHQHPSDSIHRATR